MQWRTTVDDPEQFSLFRDGVLIASPPGEDRAYRDTNLSPNTRYQYRLVARRADGTELSDELGRTTDAALPMISRQMATHSTGLQLPIIDEVNPDHTEYHVTLWGRGLRSAVSDWSTSKCRTFEGLEPGGHYIITLIARNLEGTSTKAANQYAEEGGPIVEEPRWAHTWEHSGTTDPWVQARIRDAVAVHGLTEAAGYWMNDDIFIERKRGEPGFRSSHNGQVGIGHSNTGHLMADVMRAFWSYWDGFSEPCDQMNVYTFRRDVAQFALDFRALERSGGANHLAPWRPYYNLIAANLANHDLDGENYWDVLERGEYSRFGGLWWEFESLIPGFNPHHPSLIPPRLRKYFDGFMRDGESRTWDEELDWYTSLEDADRHLWFPLVTHAILHNSPRTPSYASRTRIPEPLRTTLRNADRQTVVDFINTLEDQTPWEWWVESRGYWNFHVSFHLTRFPLYRAELDASTGIELEQSNLDAVVQALQLLHALHCPSERGNCWFNRDGRVDSGAAQVRATIASMDGLSDKQRVILMAMADLST